MTALDTWRSTLAYLGLAVFVIAVSIGGFLISAPVGFLCLGGSVFVATFLLGSD